MLDRGGSGVVYSGFHARSGRAVAIKVLRSELSGSPEMIERFVREARAVEGLDHPNIVRVYDWGTLPDRRPFLVMELLEGASLRHLRKHRGAFSPDEVIAVLTPVCAALEAVHAANYIHRDLKSSNIIVSDDCRRVTLLDFGIAKLLHPTPSQTGLTSVGHRMGTPHSMAPEQILGAEVDARTDVYSLGILTYELLTAKLPFMADTRAEIERMHLRSEPPRPSADAPVPRAVDEVVLRCLAKAPDDRYPSPSEFLDALRSALAVAPQGRESGPLRECEAVGIFVQVQPTSGRAASAGYAVDDDDEMLDALMEAVEAAEAIFEGAGLAIPMTATSNSVLGVQLSAPGEPRTAADQCREALVLARRLRDDLFALEGAAELLQITITVHADRVRVASPGNEPGGRMPRHPDTPSISGPLLQITQWPIAEGATVRATHSVLRYIEPQATGSDE